MSLQMGKWERLDDLLYTLHGKVVQKANKAVGWDKWDCAHFTNYATFTGFIGAHTYLGIGGIIRENLWETAMGLAFTGFGAYAMHRNRSYLKDKEEREFGSEVVHRQDMSEYIINYVAGPMFLLTGSSMLVLPKWQEIEGMTATGIGVGMLGPVMMVRPSIDYFASQPNVPKNKDSVYHKLKEKVKGVFSGKEPVAVGAEYSVEDLLDG